MIKLSLLLTSMYPCSNNHLGSIKISSEGIDIKEKRQLVVVAVAMKSWKLHDLSKHLQEFLISKQKKIGNKTTVLSLLCHNLANMVMFHFFTLMYIVEVDILAATKVEFVTTGWYWTHYWLYFMDNIIDK